MFGAVVFCGSLILVFYQKQDEGRFKTHQAIKCYKCYDELMDEVKSWVSHEMFTLKGKSSAWMISYFSIAGCGKIVDLILGSKMRLLLIANFHVIFHKS